ncbi:hypothetical protein E9531_16910, partial [Lampropedia puyangensis]
MQGVLGTVAGGTLIEPLTNLLDTLLNPNDGTLSVVTGLLEDLTNTQDGALGPLTELVNELTLIPGEALNPLLDTLNGLVQGLTGGSDNGLTGVVDGVLGENGLLGGLVGENSLLAGVLTGVGGLLGGLFGGGSNTPAPTPQPGEGLVTSVDQVINNLVDGTVAEPIGDLIDNLTNPTDGTLSAV